MIFVGDDAEWRRPAAAPSEITARDLLANCASELRRQAGAMQSLDAALGAILNLCRNALGPAEADAQMIAGLRTDLQMADQLRQEVEGVAKALDLLVGVESLAAAIRSDAVCACTPLMDLQNRFLLEPSLISRPSAMTER